MVNMTMAIPKELHKAMREHPEIKWSEVARQAIEVKLQTVEKDPWKAYAARHALKDWDDADELLKH
ncbi:MAG: hypothetical protein V1777_03230 [Candidatus Micrarchaeota archaeon]